MKKPIIVIAVIFVSVIVLSLSTFAVLQKNANNPLSELQYDKDAYKILCKAETFSFSGVGYAGSMSQEVKAFAKLYRSKDAKTVFYELEKDSNMQGKLYSLCAFYYLDNKYYNEQVKKYLNSKESVQLFTGCIMSACEVREIMKEPNDVLGDGFYNGGIPKHLNYYITNEPLTNGT